MSGSEYRIDARAATDGGGGDQTLSARLPEDLITELEALVEDAHTDYDNMSEVIRDFIRQGLHSHRDAKHDGEGD